MRHCNCDIVMQLEVKGPMYNAKYVYGTKGLVKGITKWLSDLLYSIKMCLSMHCRTMHLIAQNLIKQLNTSNAQQVYYA